MPTKLSLKAAESIIKKIAGSLTIYAQKAVAKKKWKLAYRDVRAPVGGGGAWIDKFRIELADGSIVKSLSGPEQIGIPLLKLLQMKDELCDPKWYGIKITVFPDGRFETEHNNDPDCANDSN